MGGQRAGDLWPLVAIKFSGNLSALASCPQITADKKSVESRTDHVLEIGARHLKIVIQPGEGDLSKSHFTEQASPINLVPSSSSPPQQEQQAAKGHRDRTKEVITKKVHQEEQ